LHSELHSAALIPSPSFQVTPTDKKLSWCCLHFSFFSVNLHQSVTEHSSWSRVRLGARGGSRRGSMVLRGCMWSPCRSAYVRVRERVRVCIGVRASMCSTSVRARPGACAHVVFFGFSASACPSAQPTSESSAGKKKEATESSRSLRQISGFSRTPTRIIVFELNFRM